jgi:glycosyltransferase involved in cell wall biosynthesis
MNISSSKLPLVSIVIPCYNQSSYIQSAIESVLNQSYRPIEIIVVNDGSTDNSLDIIKNIKTHEKIIIVTTENNGLAAARNEGISRARGYYISFLDSDDLYLPDRLKLHINFLESHPGIDISYSETQYFTDQQKRLFALGKRPKISGNLFPQLIKGNFIPSNAFVIKSDSIRKIDGYDQSLSAHEDWDMLLRLSLAGIQFGHISFVTNLVRIHPENMTKQRRRMAESEIIVINKLWQTELKSTQYNDLNKALLPLGLFITSELLLLRDPHAAKRWIMQIMHHRPSKINKILFFIIKLLLPALNLPPMLFIIKKLKNDIYHSVKL